MFDPRYQREVHAADEQRQHDVFGEILDCAYQWASGGRASDGEAIDAALWRKLRELIEGARREWREPDHGIWEVRTAGRSFTYSAALCQVALDRGAALAERFGLPGDKKGWRAEAQKASMLPRRVRDARCLPSSDTPPKSSPPV